jgi:hypothetical protein
MPKRSAKKRTGPTDASMCCSTVVTVRTQIPSFQVLQRPHGMGNDPHTERHICCVIGSRLILLGECQHDISTWRIFGSLAGCRLTCWFTCRNLGNDLPVARGILKLIDQMTFPERLFLSVLTVQNVRRHVIVWRRMKCRTISPNSSLRLPPRFDLRCRKRTNSFFSRGEYSTLCSISHAGKKCPQIGIRLNTWSCLGRRFVGEPKRLSPCNIRIPSWHGMKADRIPCLSSIIRSCCIILTLHHFMIFLRSFLRIFGLVPGSFSSLGHSPG